MKMTRFSALALSLAVLAGPAGATGIDLTNPFNHATRPELAKEATTRAEADKNLQKQIDQKGYDINTQAKRIDGVNADLQASKAAGAAAYTELKGNQIQQQTQINAVQNAAQQANVKADNNAVRLDGVEKNLGAVQGAAQTANDRATALEGRADAAEGAIRETNGAVQSVSADLQASKAAGLAIAGQLNDKIDQTRADGAAAIGQTNQAVKAVDSKANAINADLQSSKAAAAAVAGQLNGKIDGVVAAGAAAIGQTNQAVGALNGKVDNAIAVQTGINGHLQAGVNDAKGAAVNAQNTANVAVGLGQKGINDAYNAQQTANTAVGIGQDAKNTAINAQNSANHAEGTAQAAGNAAYNAQQTANYAVGQGQKNGNDIINLQNTTKAQGSQINTNTVNIAKNTTSINNLNTVTSQHTTQINNLDGRVTTNTTNIAKNTADIKATNVTVNQHTTQIANHETRITGTETVNARQDVTLNQHSQALQQNAANWSVQSNINNEYGQRLDAQDAMSSRFAGDIGSLKSQVSGLSDRINSADRKAEKALNAAAGALSVASIQFNTDVEAGFQVGAAAATLAGKNAAAVGVGGAINKNWFVSGYATQAGSASGGAVSATYSFGR